MPTEPDPSPIAPSPLSEWRPSPEATLEHLYKLETIAYLVGILSHELRSLLSPTSTYSQLALATLPPSHPLVPNLQEMLETNNQALQLLHSLETFSRSQFDPPVLFRPSVFLGDLLPHLRTLLGPTIFIRLEPPASDDLIQTDPYQLEQALRLLAMRALTSMPHGGELRLQTGTAIIDANHTPTHITPRHGAYTTITLIDTGFPVPPSQLGTLFDPPLTDPGQDPIPSLQLATVAAILRRLHGGLSAASSHDQGTRITLFLPQPTP